MLIRVTYSYWKDGGGGDMYYKIDSETGKQTILKNEVARELIATEQAEVQVDYKSLNTIKFVLLEESNPKVYRVDNFGNELEISLDVANKLINEGRATITDIVLGKYEDLSEPRIETKLSLKIYTSRFQNPALKSGKYTVVGIVRGLPRFQLGYERAGNIIDIAPPRELFNVYDREQFTEPYMAHLDRIGLERISAQLQQYFELGKDVVLCCYEDVREPNEWCHRLVFAEWWLKNTGKKIEELPNPAPVKSTKKHKMMSL